MFALVHTTEVVLDGFCRIAQVAETPFEVHKDLIWVACADDVLADQYVYRVSDGAILPADVVFGNLGRGNQMLDVEVM
jgi:hypothetical protein